MTDKADHPPSADARVRIAERKTLRQGFFTIDRYRLQHRTHDGGWTDEMEREVAERGHVGAVLPYDPERDAVVLLEQFRLPAHLAGRGAWQIEVVAGIIEDGEDAEAVVRREAVEEAGAHIEDLALIADYLPSPGGCTETTRLYVGKVDSRGLAGIHGLAEEHEDILARVVPAEEAFALLDEGRLENAAVLIALLWLRLNREALRTRWRA